MVSITEFLSSIYRKKLVKTNEKQPTITKKFNPIFHEKVTTDYCDHDETLPGTMDCLSDINGMISKFIGVKFRNSPGNINYSTFPSGWIKSCNILRGGGKYNYFFTEEWFYWPDFHRANLWSGFSWYTESRWIHIICFHVLFYIHYVHSMYLLTCATCLFEVSSLMKLYMRSFI